MIDGCEVCQIASGQPYKTTACYNFYVKDGKMYSIWYEHANLTTMKECCGKLSTMKVSLLLEARAYFKRDGVKVTEKTNTHIHMIAE